MRTATTHIDGLIQLHRVDDAQARVSVWRQSVAALAAKAVDLHPVPLEGLNPADLAASIRVALAQGLVDDLAWLSPSHAAAALFELASALPIGDERRELGRRVLLRLHEGNAETFATLAAQLAMSSRRGLAGPAIRARVALAMAAPTRTNGKATKLALALISHADPARSWLEVPSTGSLSSRRLAARLLECAAVEVVRREPRVDDNALAVFDQPTVLAAWNRLLADGEPLVWRHVAIARGLLSNANPHFAEHIENGLEPSLSSTQWRRAAVSLAARIALEPQAATARSLTLLRSELLQRDPGIAGAMVFGVAWSLESEPDAAHELLDALIGMGTLDALESLAELRRDGIGGQLDDRILESARKRLDQAESARTDDDGRTALLMALRDELGPSAETQPDHALRAVLSRAQVAFAEHDARTAHAHGLELLFSVSATLDALLQGSNASEADRTAAYLAVRDLDRTLLASSTLLNLLMLGPRTGETAALRTIREMHERFGDWLMDGARKALREDDDIDQPTLRSQRLRALLHLVDAQGSFGDDRSTQTRERQLRMARLLLARARDEPPSPMRRVVCAAAARACDALLREEVAELSDVLIVAASYILDPLALAALAEASMDPAVASVLHAHANLVRRTDKAAQMTEHRARVGFESLGALIRAFPVGASPRVEALREALFGFASAIQAVHAAGSLAELIGGEPLATSRWETLADAVSLLLRLIAGARRRMGETPDSFRHATQSALRAVDISLAQSVRDQSHLVQEAAHAAQQALRQELPGPWAGVAADALAHICRIPVMPTPDCGAPAMVSMPYRSIALPPWLPPSRLLGGFYVIRPLGTGAVGSVFVACRAEQRAIRHATRFALKVPGYGGDVARTLSHDEFFRLFREEAGALLTVPEHPNLARLVSFDAGARPKPILVMELVEGPTLQRLIETATLNLASAFELLDGVAAGLDAMHSAGVGHLDLKPSNVVLRDAQMPSSQRSDELAFRESLPRLSLPFKTVGLPVLVDFGLAGRTVRPGCATVHYGAPEVWAEQPEGAKHKPVAVDIYAFGCLIYETLAGHELFDGPTQMSVIASHVRHDGDSLQLREMSKVEALAPLAALIRGAVRRNPQHRSSLHEIRTGLRQIGTRLVEHTWPLMARSPLAVPRVAEPSADRLSAPEDSSSQPLPLPLVRKLMR
ncbi:MAG: protein kinase [Polyangiaceae bacterium]|nr:protein kinase [Polyangiaceae bacterium]